MRSERLISKNGSGWQQMRYNANGRNRKLSGGGLRSALARRSRVIYPSRWETWSKVIAGRYVSDAARRRPANIVFVRRVSSPSSLWRIFRLGPFLLTPRISLRSLIHQHLNPGRRIYQQALYQTVRHTVSRWQGLSGRQDETRRPAEPVAAAAFVTLRGAVSTDRVRRPADWVRDSSHRPLQSVLETERFVDRFLQRREPPQVIETSIALRYDAQSAAIVAERVDRQIVRERTAEQRIALRPPPMILRRRSVSAEESSGAPQSARQRAQNPSTFPADLTPGTYPSVTPLMDVSRLTDQVIQTIDRRLTAWRERMGRI
jgi:hypothetical protein